MCAEAGEIFSDRDRGRARVGCRTGGVDADVTVPVLEHNLRSCQAEWTISPCALSPVEFVWVAAHVDEGHGSLRG